MGGHSGFFFAVKVPAWIRADSWKVDEPMRYFLF